MREDDALQTERRRSGPVLSDPDEICLTNLEPEPLSSPAPVGQPSYATAADIPPELFEKIAYYIATGNHGRLLSRDLMNCSLASAFWAEQCRRAFYGGPLPAPKIRTRSRAESFRQMALKGKTGRLTSIPELVKSLDIFVYSGERSWLHLLFVPPMNKKLPRSTLDVNHYKHAIPSSFPLASFNSPHWALPRSIPPSFTPYKIVRLGNIHFIPFQTLSSLLATSQGRRNSNSVN